jgi:hypothetical protein
MRGKPEIVWSETFKLFLVDFGHLHFSVTRNDAALLQLALEQAMHEIPMAKEVTCDR